jgi:flagellar biosynthetic protein FliR
MRAELTLGAGLVYGFLMVLARVGGAFAFVPVPGFRGTTDAGRLALILGVTIALFPVWPVAAPDWSFGGMARVAAGEAVFGAAVGVAVAFLTESLLLASQIFGLQAGYSWASTIDPSSQADSSVLQVVSQLAASMLFFACGLDRELIRVFARSLELHPPGGFSLSLAAAEPLWKLGSTMFVTAMRLALPVVALLALVDLSLALLSRVNAHLQLLTLAFPVKMLAALAMLAAISPLFGILYRSAGEKTVRVLIEVFNR